MPGHLDERLTAADVPLLTGDVGETEVEMSASTGLNRETFISGICLYDVVTIAYKGMRKPGAMTTSITERRKIRDFRVCIM